MNINQQLIEKKRRQRDISKLIQSKYYVDLISEGPQYILIDFKGPEGSLYEGGIWKLRVHLPESYPYKSPSIGFVNKIFHPNVDFPFFKKVGIYLLRCYQPNMDSHV